MQFSCLTVYLFDNKLEFTNIVKNTLNTSSIPLWINGICIKNKSFVMINGKNNLGISEADYKRIIHELIHQNLFIMYCKDNVLPLWLNEGIALFFANQFSDKEKVKISKHLKHSSLPDFNSLNKNFVNLGGYHLAPSIIEFIITKYNIDMLYELCGIFSQKEYFEVGKLFDEWHQYLRETYFNFTPSVKYRERTVETI